MSPTRGSQLKTGSKFILNRVGAAARELENKK
jgi:hypothetical protein